MTRASLECPKPRLWRTAVRSILLLAMATDLVLPATAAAQTASVPPRSVTYRLEDWRGDTRELRQRFSDVQLQLLEKINRCDVQCLERLRGSLVMAESLDLDELAYSPFPSHWNGTASRRKALVVHQPLQAFAAYEDGSLIRWGPVSTGRQDRQTPPRLYHLNWRSPGRHSTVNRNWFMRWYFNIDNRRGISMHAYALPGRPASHACVRMLDRDARWLYDWGEEWELDPSRTRVLRFGTPVLIIGRYDFSAPPPWQSPDSIRPRIDLPPAP